VTVLRLREIELFGFKSFADRTRIPLPGDVMAVVGPNGAGKSNITDAILWSLGEQSAKTLRGQKMQDVIFVGTHKRPPSGMAEVLLTFEDGEGAKTQVGRRLLRTGESFYLLDGRAVRLRDIQEFMMRYAISTHGSFLVEQGRVDALLQTNPEERRVLFEEVAGIAHFKENRRSALQKLDSTQGNLLRLNDILLEVETQMNQLKRQASKADRFVRLSDELRDRRRVFWGRCFGKFTGQQKALIADLDLLREERERRETALARRQSELEQASAALSEHDASLAALIQSIHQKELEAERAEQENRRRTEQVFSGKERLRQIEMDRQELLHRSEAAAKEAKRIEAECARLEREEAEAESGAEEARRAVEEARRRSEEQDAAQAALRQKAFTLAQDHARLSASLSRLEEDLRRHGEREKRLKREEEGLAAREAALQEKLDQAVPRREELEAEWSAAKEALLAAETALARCQEELESARIERAEADQDAAAAQSRSDALAQSEASLRSSAHAFLTAKHPRLAGPTLAERLSGAGEELLPALTAALSGLLEGYVGGAFEKVEEALSGLRRERAGEAVFLAEGGRPAPIPEPGRSAGFQGWLHEGQGIPEELRPLLPRVAIAQDSAAARRIAASGVPAVTPSGLFVHPDGWVRGGAGGPGGAALLEHQREKRKAEKGLQRAQERRDAARSEEERLRAELGRLKGELEGARAREAQARPAFAAVSREIEDLEAEQRRLAASRSLLEVESAQARDEREAWEEQRSQQAADLERLTRSRTALDAEVKAGEEAIAQARREQEISHDAVAEARARHSEVAQRHKSAQAALRRSKEQREELAATDARLLQESQGLLARAEELGREITDGDRALRTLLLSLEELRQRKARFEEELRRLGQEVQARQQRVKEAREALDEAREEVSRHELSLATVESDLRNLLERMGETFEEDPAALAEAAADQPPLSEEERHEEQRALMKMEEKIHELGAVNMLAREEYQELSKRFEFLSAQRADLEEAVASLNETIRKINRTTRERFMEAFTAVQEHFAHLFKEVFEGGEARLSLIDEANPLDTGVEIYAQPPGKKLQSLQALSGGEKAMTAIALLFSLFKYRPQPFFILDEVDAPLDEANIDRFNRLLVQFRGQTQFIVVSHNKRTMEEAEVLYGITMPEGGVSRVVSVRLAEIEQQAFGVGGKA
jgi:chromosome segregation protein